MKKQIIIAGKGDIFHGDDAFGFEVVRLLAERGLPEGVHTVDFGVHGRGVIRGQVGSCDAAIWVEASSRGCLPGTLFVQDSETNAGRMSRMKRALGGKVERILIVGCEPLPPASENEMEIGLSPPVQGAVAEAVPLIESLVDEILSDGKEDLRTRAIA